MNYGNGMCIIRRVLLVGLLAGSVMAQQRSETNYVLERVLSWENMSNEWVSARYLENERVRLDLSLDGGATWAVPIADGIPSHYGTNSYPWSLRVTPDLWTERARVGVRVLWSAGTNAIVQHLGAMSATNFMICGVRILSPTNGTVISTPTYVSLQWHEAGADYVDIQTSTNGIDYTPLITRASPPGTNTYAVPVPLRDNGPFYLRVMVFEDLHDAIRLEVQNDN